MSASSPPEEPRAAAILVAEGDADHRILLELILRQEGFPEAVFEPSAEAAIARLEAEPERFGAVLMSLAQPGIDACGAIRRIHADPRLLDLPILIVAAQTEASDRERAFEAGASDYIAKPFDRPELRVRLRTALRLKAEIDARRWREAELAADIEVAARLQRDLLPDPARQAAGVSFAHRYLPCAGVSGDLLNVIELPDGKIAAFVLDVSGHGVQAALSTMALHRLLQASSAGGVLSDATGVVRDPAEVVAWLNREFQMRDDASRYFTICYALIDAGRHEVQVVQAGHSPILIDDAAGIRFFEKGDPPVGLVAQMTYRSHRIAIARPARLVLYSDGITDAEGPAGARFGAQRLSASVALARGRSADEAAGLVLGSAREFAAGREFADDVSVLVLDLA